MKKRVSWIIVIVLVLSLTGCIYKPGQRPTDYGPAIWKSSDPDIWFEVLEYDQDRDYQTKGQLTIEDKIYVIEAIFTYGSSAIFRDFTDPEIDYFSGTCDYGPDKHIVKVDLKYDNIFDGGVKEITFIRTEIPK